MNLSEPVLIGPYRLSPEFFTRTRLVNRCKTECAELCCTEGCFITIHDARRILAHRDEIQPYLVEPFDFAKWNLARPANICTPVRAEGTREQQCWFLTKDKCCALHTLAIDKNIPVASVKPYFCLMFPLTLMDIDINVNEIAIDNKAYETCLAEGESESWLYEQFEAELKRVIGEQAYAEIERRFPPR